MSTTSTGRLFHRAGAATENARLASSVRVLGTIKRSVLDGRFFISITGNGITEENIHKYYVLSGA